MNTFELSHAGQRYERISKAKARRLFDGGGTVILCPCKLYPFGGWMCGTFVRKEDYERQPVTLDAVVRGYTLYNCNHETGYYPAFYIKTEGNQAK